MNYKVPSNFNNKSYDKFIKDLFLLRDKDYLEFNKRIIFTKNEMIGIRVPILRNISKVISKGDIYNYLDCSDNKYFESVLLYGFVIGYIDDYKVFLKYFNKFICNVDNWASCDMCLASMKIIGKNKDLFIKKIDKLMKSNKEFYIRIGIVSLMYYYMDLEYLNTIFKYCSDNTNNDYYVSISIAWLLSICFIKYKDKTIKYLDNCNLDKYVLGLMVQKIRDSKRVSKKEKEFVLKYK